MVWRRSCAPLGGKGRPSATQMPHCAGCVDTSPFSPPLHAPSLPPRRGVSSLVRLLRGRWSGTALLLVGIFPRGVAASNPLREKVRRVNLGLSSLVARESSERLLFLDAAALMPLQPDGTLDRAWTFDYVHMTNEMYARYGDALLTVLRPFVQPR